MVFRDDTDQCEGEFLIASKGGAAYLKKDEDDCSAERTRKRLADQLKNYQMIKEDEEGYLDIADEELKISFIARVEEAQKNIKLVKNHLEVFKRAEEEFFDNVVEIDDALVRDGEATIIDVVADQQETLDFVVKDFSLLAFFKDIKWKDEEKYQLNPDIEIDEEWVEDTLNKMVSYAKRDSSYPYTRRN